MINITFYWMNKENEREIVEIMSYLDDAHSVCTIKRFDGSCIDIPTNDLIVVTDIEKK